jgi:hypothetical protein
LALWPAGSSRSRSIPWPTRATEGFSRR